MADQEPHNFSLEQRNWSAFQTLQDAKDSLAFLQEGVRVYIIGEDRFYYWKNKTEEFVPESQSTGADDQTATEVPYDNSTSGLTASNVQAAIDELEGSVHTHPNKAFLDTLTDDQYDFDAALVSAPSRVEGRLFYDPDDKAMSFYNDIADFTHNLGYELVVRVRNISGATITNGTVVYLSAPDSGLPTVLPAKADSFATSNAVGMATHDIGDGEEGIVTSQGLVRFLDTSSFSPGDIVYLSEATAGAITDVAPPLRTIIGQVIVADNTNGIILVGNAKLSRANNVVVVRSVSDLPTPVSNEIQLSDQITYRIVNGVDIGTNTLVMGSSTTLTGENKFADHIVYQGTGHAIRSRDVDCLVADMHIEAPNGSGIDFEDTVGNEKSSTVEVKGVVFHNIDDIGRVDNVAEFVMDNCTVLDTVTDGLSFEGLQFGDLLITDCVFRSYSGTGIDLGTAIFDIVHIDRCEIHIPTGTIGIAGLANSGNIGPNEVRGKLTNCNFLNDGGTNLNNITKGDIKWLFELLNIDNSQTIGTYLLESNTTTTTIAVTNQWTKVAGTTVAGAALERFTLSANNELTYNGFNTVKASVQVHLAYNGDTGDVYEYTVFQNGVKVPNVKMSSEITGFFTGATFALSLEALVEISTNDTFSVFVRNIDSAANVTIIDMQVSIQAI